MAEQLNELNNLINPPIIDNTVSAFETNWDPNRKDGGMDIIFYQQDEERQGKDLSTKVRADFVFVRLMAGGESLLKDSAVAYIKPCTKVDTLDNSDAIKYKITIDKQDLKPFLSSKRESVQGFKINTQMQVSLAALRWQEETAAQVDPIQKIIATWENLENQEKGKFYDTVNFAKWLNDNNAYYSAWSDVAIKYALPPINFSIWGGMRNSLVETPPMSSNDYINLKPYQYSFNIEDNTLRLEDEKYRIVGQITFDDESYPTEGIFEYDQLLWYQLKFLDTTQITQKDLYPDLERLYPDRISWDSTGCSFKLEIDNLATRVADTQSLTISLLIGTQKGLIATYEYPFSLGGEDEETSKDIIAKEPNIYFKTNKDKDNEGNGLLTVVPCPDHGSNILQFGLIIEEEYGSSWLEGTFSYSRAVVEKELSWDLFHEETGVWSSTDLLNRVYEDITAESGKGYEYKVSFTFTEQTLEGSVLKQANNIAKTSTSAVLLFDDIFLTTKDCSLKLSYNPQITNVKRNVQTIVTSTLGGAYPFIRRSGEQKYRTFNISALLSCENEQFANSAYNDQALDMLNLNASEDIFKGSMFVNLNSAIKDIDMTKYGKLGHYDKWRIMERIYRDMAMDFLYKDQVVLFKSMTEGNIFVVLSDISFTPNAQLGRNLYTFSATATEIAEANGANYRRYFDKVQEETDYILTRVYLPWAEANKTEDDRLTFISQFKYDEENKIQKSWSELQKEAKTELVSSNVLYVSSTALSDLTTAIVPEQTNANQSTTNITSLPYLGVEDFTEMVYVPTVNANSYNATLNALETEEEKAAYIQKLNDLAEENEWTIVWESSGNLKFCGCKKTIHRQNIYPIAKQYVKSATLDEQTNKIAIDVSETAKKRELMDLHLYQDSITFLA